MLSNDIAVAVRRLSKAHAIEHNAAYRFLLKLCRNVMPNCGVSESILVSFQRILTLPTLRLPQEVLESSTYSDPLPAVRAENAIILQCVRGFLKSAAQPSDPIEVSVDMDWSYFLNQVFAHGLGPLIYTRLKNEKGIPDQVMSVLRSHSETMARSNLRYTSELIRLTQALKQAGIPSLAYKGPSLAHIAYGSIALRAFGDLDILVPPQFFARGIQVLREMGYNVSNDLPRNLEKWWLSTQHDYSLISQNGSEQVELHWDVTEHQFAFYFDIAAMCKRSRQSTLNANVDTLSVEDMLVVLCVHASKHGWQRLIWISDIAAVLQLSIRDKSLDWDVLLQRAQQAGAVRALHLGLLLARGCLQLPGLFATMPPAFQKAMERDASAQFLYGRVVTCLFLSKEERARMPFPSFNYFLRLRESNRDKIRYAWRRTTELNTRDFVIGDLPPLLHGLYYFVRAGRLSVKAASWISGKLSSRTKEFP